MRGCAVRHPEYSGMQDCEVREFDGGATGVSPAQAEAAGRGRPALRVNF